MEYIFITPAIAAAITYYRKEMGFTQKELANMVGITSLQLSRIETIRIKKAPKVNIEKIKEILRIDEGNILDFDQALNKTKDNYCRICGAHLYDDSIYCHSCGIKIIGR